VRRAVLLLSVLACLLLGCHAAPSPQPAPTPGGAGSNGLHLIVAVQGQLSVKRVGWREYAPARFGTGLHFGDLLRPGDGAQVAIVCSDLTVASVTGGPSPVPCKPAPQPALVYRGSQVNTVRGFSNGAFPRVLAPRMTRILDPQPVIRWSPVAGVITYTVAVRGSGINWRREVRGATEVVYPEDAPALMEGSSYKVTVSGGGHSSDEDTAPGLGFSLLPAGEAGAVREEMAKATALNLGAAGQRLLQASIFAAHGLNAEAIDHLTALAAEVQEPAVSRAVAELYLAVNLPAEAEAAYLRALALAEQTNDVEGQALAHRALVDVYDALGDRKSAATQAREAQRRYQKLGDDAAVQDLTARLADLSKP
jgi:hypothetical protein